MLIPAALVAAAAISGGASMASSAANVVGAKASQDRANKQNVAFWDMQNKYNHPSAQMERLRSAGLNPNLVYGQGGGSQQVGDISASKAADFKTENPMSEIGKYSELKSTEINNNNMRQIGTNLFEDMLIKRATQDNIKADTDYKVMGTAGIAQSTAHQLAQTARSQFDLDFSRELRETSAEIQRFMLNNSKADYMTKNYGNQFLSRTMENRVMQTTLDRTYQGLNIKGKETENKIAGKQLGLYGDGNILTPSTPLIPRIIIKAGQKGYKKIKTAAYGAGTSARDASLRQIERKKNKGYTKMK